MPTNGAARTAGCTTRRPTRGARLCIVHRLENRPLPPSVAGRGDLSRFNQIEERLTSRLSDEAHPVGVAPALHHDGRDGIGRSAVGQMDTSRPDGGEALHALRQTDSSLGDAITANMDGDRVGRDTPSGRTMNFDPSRHLSWIVTDLDRDGRPEVFLLFEWQPASGNQVPAGVVMQRLGNSWRIACEFRAEGQVRLLTARDHGWRRFQVWSGTYGWAPIHGEPGAMECVRRGR